VSQPTEHHIRTPRTARYYTLGSAGPQTRELWIVCHGYAQLARYFIRPFAAIADDTRLVVAPEALSRYYVARGPDTPASQARVAATWMTREDRAHEIDDYIEYLDSLAAHVTDDVAQPVQLTALGFSQGAATVSRWAARGRTHIDRVVLWGASLAHELEPGPTLLRGAALTIALGDADQYADADRVAASDSRLRAAGMTYRLLRYDGGHRIDESSLRELIDGA
jgi:predicted esterase